MSSQPNPRTTAHEPVRRAARLRRRRADALTAQELQALDDTGRLEHHHQLFIEQIKKERDHFRKRSEQFEVQIFELLPRVAKLEQAAQGAIASARISTVGFASSGILASIASLLLTDALRWSVAGLGVGLFIFAIVLTLWTSRADQAHIPKEHDRRHRRGNARGSPRKGRSPNFGARMTTCQSRTSPTLPENDARVEN
jgi:type IV secretory pathway TrbD component